MSASAKKIEASEGKLKVDAIEVRADPRAEWPEMFEDAWRINRDFFYDPHMHGVDWKAMRDKYAQFLPHAAVRSDVTRIIQWMCSELAVGHHRVEVVVGGFIGDQLAETAFTLFHVPEDSLYVLADPFQIL